MLSCFSCVLLFMTLCQSPLSMGFSRQEYWSGLPCPPPGDLPDLGIEPASLMSPALVGGLFTTSVTWECGCLNTHTHTHTHTHRKPIYGFPVGPSGKEPTCQCRRHKRFRFDPWVRKIPWRKAWQPTPVFLPGESHGQRSLVGYSP